MTDPAPALKVKAIPVPDDRPKTKRGGKRVKKQKERMATTELRKQQNRMAFGQQEVEHGFGDSVIGMGMIGKDGGGKLKAVQADKRVKGKLNLTAGSLSKKHKAIHEHATSGFQTNLAFTPVQGIELANPDLEKKSKEVKEANNRWFAD